MKTLTMAMDGAVLFFQEHGGRWRLEATLDVPANALAADPYHAQRLYCATFGKGLWRSNDAGKTWEPVGTGITSGSAGSIAILQK